MHLTPYQKKQIRLVLILLIGIPATVFAVYKGIQYITMASSDPTPKDIVVSNLTTASVSISWFTEKSTESYIVPMLNGTEQSPIFDKRGEGNRFTHYVEMKNLEPDTKYSFVIMSDGEKYSGANGTGYEVTTAPVQADSPVANPIHGTIKNVTGDDVIIYAMLKSREAYPVSAVIPNQGNWIVDLSLLRKIEDKTLLKITDETEVLLVAKSGTTRGATLEGAYSSLFDSNGKLNQTMSLEIEEMDELISFFPDKARIGSTVITPPKEPDVVEEEPQEEEEVTPPTNSGDEEIPTNTYTGPYSVKRDIPWTDLVSVDIVSGLESGAGTVLISNLTDVGFTVVWRSATKQEGYIKYGISKTNLDKEAWDVRDGLATKGTYFSHVVETDRLSPNTTYYFEIYSGSSKFDNNGQKYSTKTFATLSTTPPFETRSGTLINASDSNDWVIVFKIVDNDELGTQGSSGYITAIPDDNGNWILTVGDARSENGLTYFSFSDNDILQTFFLGAELKKFDISLSQNDIELDALDANSTTNTNSVKLLSDYGIINLR